MRCKRASLQFSAYLDGQLTAAERETVREHLAGCARCRAELEALERTVRAVADLPRLQAPSELREQVMAKLESAAPTEARPPRWRRYWGAAAAVLLAVIIMLLMPPGKARREAAESAEKAAPRGAIALAERGAAAPTNAEENALRTVSNVQPARGPMMFDGHASPVFGHRAGPLAPSEQVVTLVLRSENPRADYRSAVAIAAKGGWLEKDALDLDKVSRTAGQERAEPSPLELTLRMKRSQVPLLKKALDEAALWATEEKNSPVEKRQLTAGAAMRVARAPVNQDQSAQPAVPPAAPLSSGEKQVRPAGATAGAPAAAAPAAAAPAAIRGIGGAGRNVEQLADQTTRQATEVTVQAKDRKAEAAEDPIILVTLRFELPESPVPAATAAPARPAPSATAQ